MKNQRGDRKSSAGLSIPAGLFIGMGIGFFGNFVAWMFIGLGAGFLGFMILKMIGK